MAKVSVEDIALNHPFAGRFNRPIAEVNGAFAGAAARDLREQLLLQPFLRDRPQKFFNREATAAAWKVIERIGNAEVAKLRPALVEEVTGALRNLRFANISAVDPARHSDHHDELRIHRLHTHVFSEYSRLAEHVLSALLAFLVELAALLSSRSCNVPHELRSRWDMAKSKRSGLDAAITEAYNPTIRNAIVHGGLTFEEYKITFADDNGAREELRYPEAEALADNLLDTCNGISAALVWALALDLPIATPFQAWKETECSLAWARAPFLIPTASYVTDRAGGIQAELHGTHYHWRHDHLLLDTVRAFVALRAAVPRATRYFVSLRSVQGAPCFFSMAREVVPELSAPAAALKQVGDALSDGKNGMIWLEHQRLLPKLVGNTRLGPWFNWVDAVDRGLGEIDYEVREFRNLSTGWRSRFDAHVVSTPRAIDLDDLARPTAKYVQLLFAETLYRWFLRPPMTRPIGTHRIRFFDLGMLHVYHDDRRRYQLRDNGLTENLLFRAQLGQPTGPPFMNSKWERIGCYHVCLNVNAYHRLKRAKTRAG
jgi:hypothetical protein